MNVEVTQCSWRRGEVGSGADEWNRLKRAVCSSDVLALKHAPRVLQGTTLCSAKGLGR